MPLPGSFDDFDRSINTYREGSFGFFMKVALLGFTFFELNPPLVYLL